MDTKLSKDLQSSRVERNLLPPKKKKRDIQVTQFKTAKSPQNTNSVPDNDSFLSMRINEIEEGMQNSMIISTPQEQQY